MVAATRFLLLLCSLVSILFSGIATQLAHAKLGPISIRSVYTTDENDKPKIVFMPGDRINYHVDVDNTTGSTFPVDVRFQAFANDYSPDPCLYHYDQKEHVDQMPVGLSRFYTPVTLPSSIPCGFVPRTPSYFYAARITVTPSNTASPVGDGDWGERTFTIQMTKAPEGKAPNLIVFVHGCCTDQNAVNQLQIEFFDAYKNASNTGQWEFVVWDWHEYTPQPLPGVFDPATLWKNGADAAYGKAPAQGAVLASAIALFPYQYVHLIGHSAGAKLIQDAATAYIGNYFVRQTNPFIYLTFLDAYAPNDVGKTGTGSYGSLPGDYPNHYSEQYVDKADWPFTEACLSNAFNFDITGWRINEKACPLDPLDPTNYLKCAHGWPLTWYKKSITSAPPMKFIYGYPLSLEGGDGKYTALSKTYPNGRQCALNSIGTHCAPADCW